MPITTAIVNTYFDGLRLPLVALERITKNTDTEAWPPAVAYESFEAGAKKMLGSLLRDDELIREGTLLQAKLQELAEAERLEVKADQKRMQADAQLQERRQAADAARQRAEQDAQAQEAKLRAEKAEKERKVAEEARRRQQAAAKAEALRQEVVTAQERQAERTRLNEESAALAKRSQALQATKRAQQLDDAVAAKKAQRQG